MFLFFFFFRDYSQVLFAAQYLKTVSFYVLLDFLFINSREAISVLGI